MNQQVNSQYKAVFKKSFLLPQHWYKWMVILIILILAYIPYQIRDRMSGKIGKFLGRKIKKQRRRAYANLSACFPLWEEEKKQQILDEMFTIAGQIFFSIGELGFRSKKFLHSRTIAQGFTNIDNNYKTNKNVILLVSHSWSIEVISMVLHICNIPMIGMYKPHKDLFFDWIWTTMRERFGGIMFPRQNGIKPFLMQLKKGGIGHYAIDEDYGSANSEFADFFATYKATLKGLHKLARLSNSIVLPAFTRYNATIGKYEIEVSEPIDLTGNASDDATAIHKALESFIIANPEQYMWILRILDTRKEQDPYIYN